MLPKLYYEIINNEEIKINLEEKFDFIIIENSTTDEYMFYSKEKLTIFATDGTGGVYATIGDGDDLDKLPIAFISSEGQAGKIAKSFNELIALIIYYPFWKDILKFSGNGDLKQMRKSITYLEEERIEFVSDFKKVQKNISIELRIIKKDNLIENLHKEVMEKPYFTVYSIEDNNTSDTLIGSNIF
ncbi:hypothetical protein [Abyssisolibacter fermentans]|uniref:hypothetical protein n=1 Tax=Abyssisolibacter fermentans TaxID=1766203 RepID=UPI00082C32FA|nr:hypothetical protein [Abyssisolibacter fermentans]